MMNNAHDARVQVIYCLFMHATYTTLFRLKNGISLFTLTPRGLTN